MEQITDISLSTSLICLGIYFVVLFFQYGAGKVWAAASNKIVRGIIKWVGTMWLPLWPIVIGAAGVRLIPSIPMPKMITDIAPEPGVTWTIYGAFCGMICMAVVKGIKQALEKKGIDLNIPDLQKAKLAVKNGNGKPKLVDPELDEDEALESEEDPESPDSGKEPEDDEEEDDEKKPESKKSEKD